MTALTLRTPPASEPLSLGEVKAHLRVETDAEDGLLAGYLAAARSTAECFLRRALIAQDWQLVLDRWPEGPVRLPHPPLMAVEEIRVRASDGTASVVSPETYRVETRAEPGFILPGRGETWPKPGLGDSGIEIDFTAGFGESWNAVPEPVRQALLLMIAQMHEQRGEASPAIAGHVRSLLQPYRMIRL